MPGWWLRNLNSFSVSGRSIPKAFFNVFQDTFHERFRPLEFSGFAVFEHLLPFLSKSVKAEFDRYREDGREVGGEKLGADIG